MRGRERGRKREIKKKIDQWWWEIKRGKDVPRTVKKCTKNKRKTYNFSVDWNKSSYTKSKQSQMFGIKDKKISRQRKLLIYSWKSSVFEFPIIIPCTEADPWSLLGNAGDVAWTDGCMDGWMHGWMDGWVDGWMDGWWMDGWMYGWMDKWMDKWMDG